jgi:UDP-2-acetamido-3-amino-2,3-dideoxy-glucuronate N-acetyltransferase
MTFIHSSSIIDTEVKNIGVNTKIWAYTHICKNAVIGENCTIGEGVYIGPNVKIGNNCKIQNHSLIYEGVEIEDNVFIGPNVITTNDNFPRAIGDWSDRFKKTLIKKGSSICANSTIVCGLIIGENSMIGAGSVVTKNIKDNYLAYGNPARHIRKV